MPGWCCVTEKNTDAGAVKLISLDSVPLGYISYIHVVGWFKACIILFSSSLNLVILFERIHTSIIHAISFLCRLALGSCPPNFLCSFCNRVWRQQTSDLGKFRWLSAQYFAHLINVYSILWRHIKYFLQTPQASTFAGWGLPPASFEFDSTHQQQQHHHQQPEYFDDQLYYGPAQAFGQYSMQPVQAQQQPQPLSGNFESAQAAYQNVHASSTHSPPTPPTTLPNITCYHTPAV